MDDFCRTAAPWHSSDPGASAARLLGWICRAIQGSPGARIRLVPIPPNHGGAMIGSGTISVDGTSTLRRSMIVSAQACRVPIDHGLIPIDGGPVSSPFVSAQDRGIMILPGPVGPDSSAIVGARALGAVQVASLRGCPTVVAALYGSIRLREAREHRRG